MKRRFKLRPQKPPRLVENDIEQQCLDALGWRHWRAERLHAGTFKSLDGRRFIKGHPKGTPDYVVTHWLYPAFYLETKRPGESPTPDQERVHTWLRLDNLAVVTIDDHEVLLRWLEQHEASARERWREALENIC